MTPFGGEVDEERRETPAALLGIEGGKYQSHISHGRKRDVALRPVESIPTVHLGGDRAECQMVRPGVGFCDGVGADQRARGHGAEVPLLLLIGAVVDDRELDRPHLGSQSECESVVGVAVADRFHCEYAGQEIGVHPCGVVLRGHGHRLDPEVGAPLPGLSTELATEVAVTNVVREFRACELDDALSHLGLLVGPCEIHCSHPRESPRTVVMGEELTRFRSALDW